MALVKRRKFQPSLFATVITLVAISIFLGLAKWQWDRAKYKEQQFEERMAKKDLVHLPVDSLNQIQWPEHKFRKIVTSGVFEVSDEILLDNVIRKGKAGYSVYLPLKLNDGEWILVNRGWIAAGNDRQILPVTKTPSGNIEIRGQLVDVPAKPMSLGDYAPDAEGNHRWAFWDMEHYQQVIGKSLPSYVLSQLNDSKDNLYRKEKRIENKAPMHYGYMVQWLAFALIAFISYIKLNVKKGSE